VLDYNGRSFRSTALETAGDDGRGPVGHYRQRGDLVWAQFAGGAVLSGALVGTCARDGRLDLAYCQVLRSGEVVVGRCTSTPEVLGDGRIRLREEWRRFDGTGSRGVSFIEESKPARRRSRGGGKRGLSHATSRFSREHMQSLSSDSAVLGREFGVQCGRWTQYPNLGALPFGAMWCVVPPRGCTEADRHDERELVIVASGAALVESDGATLGAATGTAVLLDGGERHVVHNSSEEQPLVLLALYWMDDGGEELADHGA
jgi:quercetin dioxygenase-like cupin family protein